MGYQCKRCGCRMDPGEVQRYPGIGDVCEDCVQELDLEAENRKAFHLTRGQQEEIKRFCPGVRLGA